jgi:hypothetical protein
VGDYTTNDSGYVWTVTTTGTAPITSPVVTVMPARRERMLYTYGPAFADLEPWVAPTLVPTVPNQAPAKRAAPLDDYLVPLRSEREIKLD